MPTMGRYCKAYPIDRFEAFPGWRPQAAADGSGGDEGYYFLQEDYTVTRDIFLEDVVFDEVSDAWRRYCHDTLTFTPPAEDAGGGGSAEPSSAAPGGVPAALPRAGTGTAEGAAAAE